MTINLNINKKFEPLVKKHKPIKIIIGGRGSGKSIAICDIMSGLKMGIEGENILCLREFQNTIQDSIHNEMWKSVDERIGFSGWLLQNTSIIAPNGAYTTYKGANRDPNSVKSMTGYKYAIFEEAQTASKDSIEKLIPTILREPGRECWFVANPQSSGDAFSQRFIVPFQKDLDKYGYYEDDLHMIVVVNWRDNPWWNEAQEAVRKYDYETMPRALYDHIWEGKFNDTVEHSIIMPEWFDAAIDAHLDPKLKEAFAPHGVIKAAHDPFDDGNDAGGFAVRHGSIITQVRSKDKGEIDDVCDWATDLARKASADWFIWDGDGMGTGLKRQVSDAFKGTHCEYHMFRGSLSGKAQDNANQIYLPADGDAAVKKPKSYADTFLNNRAQYYVIMAQRFHNVYKCRIKGQYIDPEEMISLNSEGIDDMVSLRSQLCRIPRKPNSRGLEQIMSKEEMKKLKISSPNEGDSVMMTEFTPPIEEVFEEINFKGW